MVIIEQLLMDPIKTHVSLNSDRLDTYESLRGEIMKYAERIHEERCVAGGAVPMDVDALAKGKSKGKGKRDAQGKGKGRGAGKAKSASQSACRHCNRPLTVKHTDWDCWYNPKNMDPEAVEKRRRQGSTDGRGKGKGSRKGKSGKGVQILEEVVWPTEADTEEQNLTSLFALDNAGPVAIHLSALVVDGRRHEEVEAPSGWEQPGNWTGARWQEALMRQFSKKGGPPNVVAEALERRGQM